MSPVNDSRQSSESGHSLSILYQNTRGLRSKTTDVFNSIAQSSLEIIALTETWLNASISDCELFGSEFNVYRADRNFLLRDVTRGGGVLIGVHEKFVSAQVNLSVNAFPQLQYIDVVAVKVMLNVSYVYLINLYIPPNTPFEEFRGFFEALESLHFLYDSKLVVLGDFNIPEYACNTRTAKTSALDNFSDFFGLTQNNFVFNQNNKLLDLVLTNWSCLVERSLEPLVEEDVHHPALEVTVSLNQRLRNNNILKSSLVDCYNFRRANFYSLYDLMSGVDWSWLGTYTNPEDASIQFYGKLYNLFDQCVPKYSRCNNNKYPPWFDSNIVRQIREKSKYWRLYKRSNDIQAFQTFKRLRAAIKIATAQAYKQHVNKFESEISTNSSKFWAYVNSKRTSGKVASVMTYRDTQLNDPSDILNGFAKYFSESYAAPSGNAYGMDNCLSSHLNISIFDESEVLNILKTVKPKMTTGPDNVPAFILKDCASVLARPLTILVNLCLKSGTFPSVWKSSKVCPIFKSGSRSEIECYRPISIICNFCKVFEMLLEQRIYNHIHDSVTPRQHGFMKGRSTVSNLCVITQDIAENIDSRTQTDVIYTDLTKAFDRLDHGILLQKLSAFGLSDQLVMLFRSYLTDRTQYVQLNGFKSVKYLATSGVPQGSNLGPLLFNLYMNDIVDVMDVNFLLYADDLKIYAAVRDLVDCERLSANLSRIVEWCVANNLQLNVRKCKVLSYTLKKDPIVFAYCIRDQSLERPNTFTDLGVTFDSSLSFNYHFDNIIELANRMYGFITRISQDFSDVKTFKTLYYAYIKSKLEYASPVWSPFYRIHIDRLESVQRRFLKYLTYRIDGVYPPIGTPHDLLLSRHGFPSLEVGRKCRSVITLHKIIKNDIQCPDLLHKLNFNVPRLASRCTDLFYLSTPRTNILKNSPLYNACYAYNNISQHVDIFQCSVRDIKRHFFLLLPS